MELDYGKGEFVSFQRELSYTNFNADIVEYISVTTLTASGFPQCVLVGSTLNIVFVKCTPHQE